MDAQATIQLAGGTGSIGNFVWTDNNGDSFQNQGELGLSNVTVNLYNNSATLVATTTTSATGIYNFTNVATGQYSLGFAAPNGYLFSAADRGTDNSR